MTPCMRGTTRTEVSFPKSSTAWSASLLAKMHARMQISRGSCAGFKRVLNLAFAIAFNFGLTGPSLVGDGYLERLWHRTLTEIGGFILIGNQNHEDLFLGAVPIAHRRHILNNLVVLLSNPQFGKARYSLGLGFELEVNGIPPRERDLAARMYAQIANLNNPNFDINFSDSINLREQKIRALLRADLDRLPQWKTSD